MGASQGLDKKGDIPYIYLIYFDTEPRGYI